VQEIYLWVAENCPGMENRLLLTFSSMTDTQTRSFLQEHNVPSLAKPFEVADLISQVRAIAQKHAKVVRKINDEKAASATAGN